MNTEPAQGLPICSSLVKGTTRTYGV